MKIFYVANLRLPAERAYGIQIAKMCEAMGLAGHDIVLIYPKRKNIICAGKNLFDYYGIKQIFKIKEIISPDFIKFNLGQMGYWLSALFFYFYLFFYLVFNLRDYKIVITRDFYGSLFFRVLGKKVVAEIHYLPDNFSLFFEYFARLSDKIVVLTESIASKLSGWGISRNKILVLPDGVDLASFDIKLSKEEAREKIGFGAEKNIVLYCGHLYPWKGVYTLADASLLLDSGIKVIFVGGTANEDVPRLKEYVDKKGIKNIIITGPKNYSEVPYYLKSADILILPNSAKERISRFYTSPLKMFEYMASDRPIVAADITSLKEILNEENAIFFQPDNVQDLAEKIKMVFSKKSLAENIAIQALADAKEYSWQKRSEKLINFING